MAELSSLEVLALAKEIDSVLKGTYVKNVYSLGSSQVLKFGAPERQDIWIIVSPRAGVWVSHRVAERGETTAFTTKLRQELLRARFESATQFGGDRIFDISLDGEEAKHLLVELMPPGNIVVADGSWKVKALLNEVRSPLRRLARGEVYVSPRARRTSPSEATADAVGTALSRGKTVGEAVGRTFAVPRKYVVEVLARLGLEESSPPSSLKGREAEAAGVLLSLREEAETSGAAFVCETSLGEEILAVTPRTLKVKEKKDSISDICDELLYDLAAVETPRIGPDERRRQELKVTAARLRTSESDLMREAAAARERATEATLTQSETELKSLLDAGGVKGWRRALSPQTVASALFDRAKELEEKAAEAEEAALALTKKAKRVVSEKPRRTVEIRRSQEWYEKFRWFSTKEGKLAIGGRDAQSNSILVGRHLDATDTVYHADLFGSPFFILKGGKNQTEEESAQVAQATVAFSSAWKTGLGVADAYWVHFDQVSRSAPSGEFLPRGGFLITGKKNFVPRNLVELAVGVNEEGRVISGPESAIGGSAVAYVVLRPQKEKSSDTAKRVKRDLETLAQGQVDISLTVDDVLRMLPAGGGKVVRRHRRPEESARPGNA